jgi:hypothetical protein
VPSLARHAMPSAQARPGDWAGPARARFTTCRVGFLPGRVSSRSASPIRLDIYICKAIHRQKKVRLGVESQILQKITSFSARISCSSCINFQTYSNVKNTVIYEL